MKVWLELSKVEAEAVFEFIKDFSVEGRKTVADGNLPKEVKPVKKDEKEEEPDSPVTLEQIRKILQEKRLGGKGAQVNTLVKSYGVTSLPDIPKDKYPELMEKAKVI